MRAMFRVFLALLALAGPAGAQDFKASGQPGAFQALTINQQTAAGTAALTINNHNNTASHVFSHVTNRELQIEHENEGVNSLILLNKHPSGFSAIVSRGADVQFPSTNQTAAGYYEHMAIGYGRGLALNGRSGLNYIESSRFDGALNRFMPPTTFTIQQTGGACSSTTYQYNAVMTSGSANITINGGGSWPADANAMIIREAGDGRFITPGTTISSGQGTATLVMSAAALATNGFVPVVICSPVYGQYNAMVFRDLTSIDVYPWATGATATGPFMRMDRLNKRLLVGDSLGNGSTPVSTLDVIGKGTFGTDTTQRTAAFASYPVNIADSGTAGLKWLKVGVNTFLWNWNASPSRLDFYEGNSAVTPFSMYMDGTARTKTGGGRIQAIRVVTAAGAITAATTDDVICVNKSVGAATTVNLYSSPSTGSVLVVKDCKGDAAANNITITPAAGTLDGAASLALTTNYAVATIQYNGTQWNRIGQ